MPLLERIAAGDTLLVIFLVPLVMALVGWAASWLAIEALFRPRRFIGVGRLGWQGIVPARAGVIAPRLVDGLLQRVGTLQDVFAAMDPQRLAEHIVMSLRPRAGDLIEDVVLQEAPELWDALSVEEQRAIAGVIERRLPEVATALVADIGRELDDVISIDHLVQQRLVARPENLIRLFREVGRQEFGFLAHAGVGSGAVAGIAAVGCWLLWPQAWLLPLVGGLVAAAGSALCLHAVYRPLRPGRFLGWKLHGLLPANQELGAQVGARLFTRDVISVRNLVEDALGGPGGHRLRRLIERHTRPMVSEAMTAAGDALRRAQSPAVVARVEASLARRAVDVALEPLGNPSFNHERQVVLEDVFANRLLDLTAAEYEALLRPAVRDSEWMLIASAAGSGVLGGMVMMLL